VPKIGGFPLTLIVALTTVLRTTVLDCDGLSRVAVMFHGASPGPAIFGHVVRAVWSIFSLKIISAGSTKKPNV